MASNSKPSSASMTCSCRSSSAIASSSNRRPTATATRKCGSFSERMTRKRGLERQHLQEVQQHKKAAPEPASETKETDQWQQVEDSHTRQAAELLQRHQEKRRRSCASMRPINRRLNASILHNSRCYSVSTRSKCSLLSSSMRSRCRRSRVRAAAAVGAAAAHMNIARAVTGIRVRSTSHRRTGA